MQRKQRRFRSDRWLDGKIVERIAPSLMTFVRPAARYLTVANALLGKRWIAEIRGAPSVQAITEFFDLWDLLGDVSLGERGDKITWKLTIAGMYTAKSAYNAFFTGRTRAPAATELWTAGEPLVHKLHLRGSRCKIVC